MAAALAALRGHVSEAAAVAGGLRPVWGLVAASAAVVIATYLLLVQVWRGVLRGTGGALSFRAAAYVWFVSNLARYIPGALWQIGALGVLAQRHGVSPLAATGAAVVVTIANVVAGLLVLVAATPASLNVGRAGFGLIVLGALALLLAPLAASGIARAARSLSGRDIQLAPVGPGATAAAVGGNVVAWLLYGLAFMLLTRAVLPGAHTAGLLPHVVVYAGSYLAGFLAIAPPAGLGVAEAAMIRLAPEVGIATVGQAAVLAVIVRLWRTALEIVPGLIMLAVGSGTSRGATR